MNIDQLDTPAIIVDLDKLQANIERLQHYLDEHGIANRPHIKTHKIPAITQMQIDAGAVGITCQKLGEVEVMAEAGFKEIFLPYNIVGEIKLERLARLMKRANLSVTADSAVTVRGLSSAAQKAGKTLPVLIEFETGANRCGVQTPQEAAELARLIESLPGLRFEGLMTYPSNERSDPFVVETKRLLESDGLEIRQVSYGGTPVMWQAHSHQEVTEYRAGTYVYGDRRTVSYGAMTVDECAMGVIATVVSRPTEDRGVLDAGSKTLSSDLLGLEGHGLILEYPNAVIFGLSEEHGRVDFSNCERKPEIGERVTVLPNHCCVVSNLFTQVAGVRGDQVEVVWPVAARDALQ